MPDHRAGPVMAGRFRTREGHAHVSPLRSLGMADHQEAEAAAGFYCLAFPLSGMCCSERPGAVKGAPLGAAERTLDGEDRSERIHKEGKQEIWSILQEIRSIFET